MRRNLKISLVFSVLLLSACAQNPTNRWAQARISLTTVELTLVDLNAAGTLSDERFIATAPGIRSARAGLSRAEKYLPEGGGEFRIIIDGVVAYIRTLRELR